jgi:serine/threonine protein kinase
MKQQTCNPDLLDQFLQNELSEIEEQQFTLHLDECADCREELESRAAERTAWQEASSMLGGRMVADRSAIHDQSLHPRSPQIEQVLHQLTPTDDPAMLGRIGSYEVSGVVGAGGMGVVLKAHDRSLDRIVAIKVMSPHLASSGSARKRFAREAKAAAAVLHPNVIAIHGVASDDACPYLVMPDGRGASLQKRIDSQGPLPLKDTLRIGAQIASGLAAAHEQGLVHRDIKPANILLEEGVERVTITDFGLARAVDDASMTCSGVIAGTPQYMSPEQTRGEPIDARSDLFSLGSVLYAMCAGRSPFRAETTYGVLHRIANDNPTPICEVNSDVPLWLSHIVERLMAKRPDDRFDSATQVAELLEGCLAHVQQPTVMRLPEEVAKLVKSFGSRTNLRSAERLDDFRYRPIIKFIAAAAFAFSLIFAGVLIVLELNKGTLTIECDAEDVPIRIMQGKETVQQFTVSRHGATTRLQAGNYTVEVHGNVTNYEIVGDHVTLKRGQESIAKVTITEEKSHSVTMEARPEIGVILLKGAQADVEAAKTAIQGVRSNIDERRPPVQEQWQQVENPESNGANGDDANQVLQNAIQGITENYARIPQLTVEIEKLSVTPSVEKRETITSSTKDMTYSFNVAPVNISRSTVKLNGADFTCDTYERVGDKWTLVATHSRNGDVWTYRSRVKNYIRTQAASELPSEQPVDPREFGGLDQRFGLLEQMRRCKALLITKQGDITSIEVEMADPPKYGYQPHQRFTYALDTSRNYLPISIIRHHADGNLNTLTEFTYDEVQFGKAWFMRSISQKFFTLEVAADSSESNDWRQLILHKVIGNIKIDPEVDSTVVDADEASMASTSTNEKRTWEQPDPYAPPNFKAFFPDSKDGPLALDLLLNAADKDSRPDAEILKTVREGFRNTQQHRRTILLWIGNKYIWNKSPQNPDAIEIMYHAADFSGEDADPSGPRHAAVYFGLSVTQPKTPAILRTLAALSMRVDDPNDLDRIAWGCRNQKDELLEYLKPFEASDDEAVRIKADVCRRIFSGELKAFAWAAEQARQRAAKTYRSQLPQFNATLMFGSSEERLKALQTIRTQRIVLIMDDSFVAAFAKCAEDKDPEVRVQATIIAGARWVWEAEEQNQEAIELMLKLSKDEHRDVRYNAVYYGLSTVRNKSDDVIRRLLEMAFDDREPNLFNRIEWVRRDDRERVATLLTEYINGDNATHAKAAQEVFKQLTGGQSFR